MRLDKHTYTHTRTHEPAESNAIEGNPPPKNNHLTTSEIHPYGGVEVIRVYAIYMNVRWLSVSQFFI